MFLWSRIFNNGNRAPPSPQCTFVMKQKQTKTVSYLNLCLNFHLNDIALFRWRLSEKIWTCEALCVHRKHEYLCINMYEYLCINIYPNIIKNWNWSKENAYFLHLYHLWSIFLFYDNILPSIWIFHLKKNTVSVSFGKTLEKNKILDVSLFHILIYQLLSN